METILNKTLIIIKIVSDANVKIGLSIFYIALQDMVLSIRILGIEIPNGNGNTNGINPISIFQNGKPNNITVLKSIGIKIVPLKVFINILIGN